MTITPADFVRYEDSVNACWVQDVKRARFVWANSATARMMHATSVDELYARDLTPQSDAAQIQLAYYLQRVTAGKAVKMQWTSVVKGRPITFFADIHACRIVVEGGDETALFFEAREAAETNCAEALRLLDAARHSMAFLSLFSFTGELLGQNPSFVREFNAILPEPGDTFAKLFCNSADAEHVRNEVITRGKFRGRCLVATDKGAKWHMLMSISIPDAVSGERVMHVESFDLTDQVEAELLARDTETLMQQIADEYPHPVAYLQTDRTYRFVNKTYCNWLGQSREKIIGHTVLEIAGQELNDVWDEITPRIVAGERVQYERRADYPGRGERWIEVDVVPHHGSGREISGYAVFGYDIHALRLAEASRKTSERQLQLITDHLPVAVATFDAQDRLRFANEALRRWFGLRPESLIGRHASEIVGQEAYQAAVALGERARSGEVATTRRQVAQQGEMRWIDTTIAPFDDGEDNQDGLIAVYADVTKRVEANEALNEARNTLTSHLANTPLAVIQLDAYRRITQWTGRAAAIFGFQHTDVFGKHFDELGLFEIEVRSRFEQDLHWLDIGNADRFTFACRNVRQDGGSLHADWFGSVLRDGTGRVSSYLLLVQDVSARITAESHLKYVANHDVLTGLANRSQFQERLKTEIARARRLGHSLGVMLLDLDRFKYVNESLGHSAGDILLREVSLRFSQSIGENDLIARTGGDEFMLLINMEGDEKRADKIAEELRRLLIRPFRVGDQDVFVTASIGVSVYAQDAETDVDLIKNADWAMYRAKDAGRNCAQYYSHSLAKDAPMRLSLESELHQALELNQFELHYQPKQNLFTKRITGAEALLRWRHPLRGLVPPDEFIPLAEESGLINALGEWVTREACRQIAQWRTVYAGVPMIAINLSGVQLKRVDLASEILAELRNHNLPGSALMVEVTETAVVSDPLLATRSLNALRDHGVHAAIDDFGKGFSSLTQLKRLPIDALKIDGSFVRGVVIDRDDAAIVQAIIGLARNLELHVIAEGLETKEQLAFLTNHQCEEAQGYLISRPLAAVDFASQFLGNE